MFSFPLHFHLLVHRNWAHKQWFTHLVKALWSHQGVGTAISQPSISSPVAIRCWPSEIPEWSAAAGADAVAQTSRRVKSLPWSPNPTACGDLVVKWDGEGVAGTELSVGWRIYLHGLSWAVCPTHVMLAPGADVFLHACSLPLPSPVNTCLDINANHYWG